MKALVVDDSGLMRRILLAALAKAEIDDVVQAADGTEAVAAVVEQDFDLVLMDWNLPNLKGIDAIREIRRMGCDMPIIMVTSEAEKVRVIEAIKAGADNYVVKPFDPGTLAARILEMLARRQAPRGAG